MCGYAAVPSAGGSSLEAVNGGRARALSGTRVGMSHPGVMGQERSYALLLNQHDKAFCRTQTANGTIRRGVNAARMTSIPSIDASALRLAQLVTIEQTGDHDSLASKARL